jgi:hypothetical protein
VIAQTLGAEIKNPQEVDPSEVEGYSLVGFGSGIYFSKHHGSILKLVDKLPHGNNKTVFIFSTSGDEGIMQGLHKNLRRKLELKGTISRRIQLCWLCHFSLHIDVGGIQRTPKPDVPRGQTFAEYLKRSYNGLRLCAKPSSHMKHQACSTFLFLLSEPSLYGYRGIWD